MTRQVLWLILILLSGCLGSFDDKLCAEDCIERGRDDGQVERFQCVCLIYEDGGTEP
jgi:hypothetical protein